MCVCIPRITINSHPPPPRDNPPAKHFTAVNEPTDLEKISNNYRLNHACVTVCSDGGPEFQGPVTQNLFHVVIIIKGRAPGAIVTTMPIPNPPNPKNFSPSLPLPRSPTDTRKSRPTQFPTRFAVGRHFLQQTYEANKRRSGSYYIMSVGGGCSTVGRDTHHHSLTSSLSIYFFFKILIGDPYY